MKGKGMYIWMIRNCEDGNISNIIDKAVDCNFKHVLIKIADGSFGFNYIDGVDAAKQLADGLKAKGIDPIGWQYIYGINPELEADTANKRMRETGCVGFVINAEQQYRDDPDNIAKAEIYNSHLDFNVPIALSTYRYPEVHPEFPYEKFLEVCSMVMPQVYWMEADNPAEQLDECIFQYRRFTDLPILPTGSAFCEHGWCPTSVEIIEFSDRAQYLGLPGVNYWEWSNTKANGFMPVVRDYEWITEEDPDPAIDCCAELVKDVAMNALLIHDNKNDIDLLWKIGGNSDAYLDNSIQQNTIKADANDADIETLFDLVKTCSSGIAELARRLDNLQQGQLELAENGLGYEDKFAKLDRLAELDNELDKVFDDDLQKLEDVLATHSHLEPVGGTFWQRLRWLFTGRTSG